MLKKKGKRSIRTWWLKKLSITLILCGAISPPAIGGIVDKPGHHITAENAQVILHNGRNHPLEKETYLENDEYLFSMVFASDLQIGYEKICSRQKDHFHSESIRKLNEMNDVNLRGVVINGDLTNMGGSSQWDRALNFVHELRDTGLNVAFGLGNHGLSNPGSGGKARSVKRLYNHIKSDVRNVFAKDYSTEEGTLTKKYRGSFSYAWDVSSPTGDKKVLVRVRFIQLNLHPNCSKSFNDINSDAVTEKFRIKRSYDWLERVLNESRDRYVVINMHNFKYQASAGTGCNDTEGNTRLRELLNNYNNIIAINSGHLHGNVGYHTNCAGLENDEIDYTIPNFYNGSTQKYKYLVIDFNRYSLQAYSVQTLDDENIDKDIGLDDVAGTARVNVLETWGMNYFDMEIK